MTCPWDGFDPATISFCEERLCSTIAEPANAFTSLSKSVVGLWLIARCVRVRATSLWALAIAALIQGPLGFALHATGTFWGEALDVSGMFLISATLLTFSLGRRKAWAPRRLIGAWLALVVSSTSLLLIIRPIGIPLFAAQLAGWLTLEAITPTQDRRWLFWTIGVFSFGFACWLADKTRLWCDPTNHLINGHALWHVATSICLALFFEYEARNSTEWRALTRGRHDSLMTRSLAVVITFAATSALAGMPRPLHGKVFGADLIIEFELRFDAETMKAPNEQTANSVYPGGPLAAALQQAKPVRLLLAPRAWP